jgi:hypothetical protein
MGLRMMDGCKRAAISMMCSSSGSKSGSRESALEEGARSLFMAFNGERCPRNCGVVEVEEVVRKAS